MSQDDRAHLLAYAERLDNHILQERLEKVRSWRGQGVNPFANGFEVTHTAAEAYAAWSNLDAAALAGLEVEVRVAGRIRLFRKMGKAAFVKLQDRTCLPGLKGGDAVGGASDDHYLQIFVSQAEVGEESFKRLQSFDLGDIIGVVGRPMRTKTGELSIAATRVVLLTKSIRPLPEKFKGLSDVEQRLRQRYVDLIMNDEVRQTFLQRTRIVRLVRKFLDERGFLEVETPMLHVTAGGAAARPFATHHNALDMELFLRIAPELHLKRLLVGGLERVYELNRNFRNEGLSRRHNPEFTMLEFYQAYATYEHLMGLTEEMIAGIAEALHGRDDEGRVRFRSEGHLLDLSPPWRRVSVAGAVAEHWGVPLEVVADRTFLEQEAARCGVASPSTVDAGRLLMALFEARVEATLIQPTFVTDFPASVSPLARRKDGDPDFVDRFELFVLGRELANAFSELNDPEDQYVRFARQLEARQAGDDEAMPMDEDYIRALEYGMPPAAGEGIGIDRLVMLLTGAESIRDVLYFPHMRPEADSGERGG